MELRKSIKEDIELADKHEKFKLIDEVLERYGNLSAFQLENLSHKEKPWNEARKGLEPHEASNNIIEEKQMKDFYKGKLETA